MVDLDSTLDLSRKYLRPGQAAPAGVEVQVGPRGGRYYDTEPVGNKGKVIPEIHIDVDEDFLRNADELFEKAQAGDIPRDFLSYPRATSMLARMFLLGDERAVVIADAVREAISKVSLDETPYESNRRRFAVENFDGKPDQNGYRFLYRIPSMAEGVGFVSLQELVGALSQSPDFDPYAWGENGFFWHVLQEAIPVLVHRDDVIAGGLEFYGQTIVAFRKESDNVLSPEECGPLLEELGIPVSSYSEWAIPKSGAFLGYAKAIAEAGLEGVEDPLHVMGTQHVYFSRPVSAIARKFRQRFGPVLPPLSWPDDLSEIPGIGYEPERAILAEARRRGVTPMMRVGGSRIKLHEDDDWLRQNASNIVSEFDSGEKYSEYTYPAPEDEELDERGRRNLSFVSHAHRVMKEFSRVQERWPALRVALREMTFGVPRSGARNAAWTNGAGGRAVMLVSRDWGEDVTEPDGIFGIRFHPIGSEDTVEDVFRHELGHVVDESISNEFAQLILSEFDMVPFDFFNSVGEGIIPKRRKFMKKYGKYSASNAKELWAECFALYTHPEYGKNPMISTFSKDVEEFFEDILSKPYAPVWKRNKNATSVLNDPDFVKEKIQLPDRIGQFLRKHLPGEHDQKDHGRRRGRNRNFVGFSYAERFDDPDVTVDSVLDKFPDDVREKISDVEYRASHVVQSFDRFYRNGEWAEERVPVHDKILREFFSEDRVRAATPPPGKKPTFIMLGGRGGSGKSQLKGRAYDPDKFIIVDPDKIKEMLPEYQGWNANEVHDESSYLADRIVDLAKRAGLNVVLDKTMRGSAGVQHTIQEFKDAGYDFEAHYMFLPRQKAAERAVNRFLTEGRFVLLQVILANRWNEKNFDTARKEASKWSFWDNDVKQGEAPVLVAEGGMDD